MRDVFALPLTEGDLVWCPDRLLGPGFEEAPLGPATLVRAVPRRLPWSEARRPRAAVLHVHGYNDYFFQSHLADAVRDAGHAFYAVDLRRAGRSLLAAGSTELDGPDALPPHYTADLREPGADLSAAARAVRLLEPGLPLVVHAHSTGGLTAAVWAHAVRDDAAARPDLLVLDSPFLDLAGSWLARSARSSVVGVLGRRRPLTMLSSAPSVYATYQHVDHGGRWDFDTRLKRPAGQPARAGWLSAVLGAQRAVSRGLGIVCPVLVARAGSSGPDSSRNPRLDSQDTVLDVRRIALLGPRLGAHVTELVVDGGVHDLTLSAEPARQTYLDAVSSWVQAALEVRASR